MSAATKAGIDPNFYYGRHAVAKGSEIPDLSLVTLTVPARTDEGQIVPAGTLGTVVGVWGAGAAYEVEFTAPFEALATVEAGCLRIKS